MKVRTIYYDYIYIISLILYRLELFKNYIFNIFIFLYIKIIFLELYSYLFLLFLMIF